MQFCSFYWKEVQNYSINKLSLNFADSVKFVLGGHIASQMKFPTFSLR